MTADERRAAADERVYAVMAGGGEWAAHELQQATGVYLAQAALARLKAAGRVKLVRRGHDWRYAVRGPGEPAVEHHPGERT